MTKTEINTYQFQGGNFNNPCGMVSLLAGELCHVKRGGSLEKILKKNPIEWILVKDWADCCDCGEPAKFTIKTEQPTCYHCNMVEIDTMRHNFKPL